MIAIPTSDLRMLATYSDSWNSLEECCRCSTNHRQALLQLGMVGVWFSPFKAHALAAILDKYLIKVLKMFVSDANLLPKKQTLAHSRQQMRINSGRLHPV